MAILFGFKGRMTRSAWWLTRLCAYPAAFVAMVALYIVVAAFLPQGSLRSGFELLVFLLVVLVLTWIEIATSVRRLHDLDMSGWFYLISLIPLVGIAFYIVVLGCLPGVRGPNNFGSPPKQKETDRAADVFA